MKKLFLSFSILFLLFGNCISASADDVFLYVDAAPNVFGSPDYQPWKDATFATVAAGTFTNMSNGVNSANIGTTDFEIEDEVVYSFGDLGKRLTWIYWVPGETVASLTGRFKISLTNIWDGDVLDFYDYYYGSTWLEPANWQDYDVNNDDSTDGVIGMAGMAWWGANGVNTQEALDEDIAAWMQAEETWIFTAKIGEEEFSITSHRDPENPVPEPTTMLLLGAGLIGLAGIGRKKIFRKD